MGPAKGGGLGASGGAVAATLIVALLVLVMVAFGGGVTRSLVTPHPHASLSQGAETPASQSQG